MKKSCGRNRNRQKNRHKNAFISMLLLSGILLSGILLSMIASTPITAEAVEANAINDARYAVVRIMMIAEDGNHTYFSSGTGFGIGSGDGYADTFITNGHVITSSGQFDYQDVDIYILLDDETIFYYDDDENLIDYEFGNAVKCEVLYAKYPYPDVAILKTEEPVEGVEKLPLRRVTTDIIGQAVYTIGYPGSADAGSRVYTSSGYYEYQKASVSAVSVATGTVSRCLAMERFGSTYCIEHNVHINHGNSGGPLLLEDGSVVGINTYAYGESANNEYADSIYIDYAIDALDSLGIVYTLAEDSEEPTTEEPTTEEPTTEPVTTETPTKKKTVTEPQTTEPSDMPAGVWVGIGVGAAALLLIITVAVIRSAGKKKQDPGGGSGTIPNRGAAEAGATGAGSTDGIGAAPGGLNSGAAVPGAMGSAAAQSEYRIQGVKGAFAGRRFRPEAETYIGRNGDRGGITYPVGAAGVSGHHCVIRLANGGLTVTDLGSTYGTFVNGVKLTPNRPVPLNVGDVICIGSDREKFQITRRGGVIS
ncbi:MAG: trypsin-like peptidase domain-containing protein [Lachnospiraceae bacterium]|nr:trypsin-like peptidase domain-containing protein [Lachnospiraceae bacterium]